MPKFKFLNSLSVVLFISFTVLVIIMMLTLDKPLATVYYDCKAVMIDSNAPSHIKQHCEKRKNDNR